MVRHFLACLILLLAVSFIATFIAFIYCVNLSEPMSRQLTLQLSALLVFSLFSLHLLSQNEIAFPFAAMPEAPATLLFDYPTQVNAGDAFVLTCTIKKNRPVASSTLSFITVPGFAVQPFTLAGAEVVSSDNKTTLSWKPIIENPQITFSIKVAVGKVPHGVYPLITEYSDSHGYQSRQTLSIYLQNPAPEREYVADPFAGKNPYTITLLHPETVKPKEEFEIKMQLAKGKNTGAATVMLRIPSAASITLDGYPEAIFKNGQLMAKIPTMPSSPVFEITAHVKNNAQRQAVYPVRASVTYNDGFTASWESFIYTGQKSAITPPVKSPSAKSIYDTTSVFSRLDSLLNEWTATVPAVKTRPPDTKNQTPVAAETPNDTATKVAEAKPETDFTNNEIPKNSFYAVQVVASKAPLETLKSFLQSMGIQHIVHENYDGIYYRYCVGEFETADQAKIVLAQISEAGFPDAFVVFIEDAQRCKKME